MSNENNGLDLTKEFTLVNTSLSSINRKFTGNLKEFLETIDCYYKSNIIPYQMRVQGQWSELASHMFHQSIQQTIDLEMGIGLYTNFNLTLFEEDKEYIKESLSKIKEILTAFNEDLNVRQLKYIGALKEEGELEKHIAETICMQHPDVMDNQNCWDKFELIYPECEDCDCDNLCDNYNSL